MDKIKPFANTVYSKQGVRGLQKFNAIYQHRQIVDLAFKIYKIKTKYNALAQSKFESLLLSTALLAIY